MRVKISLIVWPVPGGKSHVSRPCTNATAPVSFTYTLTGSRSSRSTVTPVTCSARIRSTKNPSIHRRRTILPVSQARVGAVERSDVAGDGGAVPDGVVLRHHAHHGRALDW